MVDVIHPGRANVPKAELQEKLAGVSKVALFRFNLKLKARGVDVQSLRTKYGVFVRFPHAIRGQQKLGFLLDLRFVGRCQAF